MSRACSLLLVVLGLACRLLLNFWFLGNIVVGFRALAAPEMDLEEFLAYGLASLPFGDAVLVRHDIFGILTIQVDKEELLSYRPLGWQGWIGRHGKASQLIRLFFETREQIA